MTHLLPSEILSLKYDAPHQRAKVFEDLENDNERCRLDYDRAVEYFEREPTSYISSGERWYSNPVSL